MNSSDAFLRVLYNLVKNDKLNGGLLFKKADIVSKIPEIINRKKIVIGIAGESASGKTTFINTMRDNFRCTVLSCDDYYRDTSKELREAGSFEALFKTGIALSFQECSTVPIILGLRKDGNSKINIDFSSFKIK